ncbi:MAG: GTPase ObgE [Verrucomicrobiota bacterium]
MFIDEIKVYARAGHGGRGSVAFLREAFRPKGGPSGGDGGRGGSVILRADHDLNNLIAQYYQPRLLAQNGEHGMGKGMNGKAGKDLVVRVPCGTLIWRLPFTGGVMEDGVGEVVEGKLEEGEAERVEDVGEDSEEAGRRLMTGSAGRPVIRHSGGERALEIDLEAVDEGDSDEDVVERELVADLTEHGQEFVLCSGGRGGLGNRHFATATRQAPRFAQPGEPGGEGEYLFELRIMADVGLVGYPNAGKSTLLTAVSRARPKVAPYPFTTLHPQIGIVEYEDWHRLVMCDVPGLVEGAHKNVGLGHAFLRHIQRCRVLVFLLDMAGVDGRAPWDDYRQLCDELSAYNPELLERPRLVVANKMDEVVAEENLKKFKRRVPKTPVLPIAAAFDEGLPRFLKLMREAVEAASANDA